VGIVTGVRAGDYMLILAGVGGWATFNMWIAGWYRRRLLTAWDRAVASVGDEAEEWLRGQ
jgi:hypothetical protein